MADKTKMIGVAVPVEWVPAITRKRKSMSISRWLRGLIKTSIDPHDKLADVNEPGRPLSATD